MSATDTKTAQENPLLNILFNIVFPVMILNQVGPRLAERLGEKGPVYALILAVLLPIGYGIYDYRMRRQANWISILGLVNVLFTGGFAILKLDGGWFALKEAFFPLLIGIAVMFSNFISKPFIKTLFWNGQVFDITKIEGLVDSQMKRPALLTLFKNATFLFSISFFISALLNYVLASRIFIPIDTGLADAARDAVLNEQIAKMTWQGYLVIALPMMIFMLFILWYFLSGLKKITGLTTEELMPGVQSPSSSSPR